MKLPELTDFSPELADAQRRRDDLYKQRDQRGARYRQLIGLKVAGSLPEDHKARVQATLEGTPLPPATSIDTEISNAQADFDAIESAIQILNGSIHDLKRDAGQKLCASLSPQHDIGMKKLALALLDAYAAHGELYRMKRGLIGNGCGLYGIFPIDSDFLGSPEDRASPLADFLRGAKAAGYISSIPKELR